MNIYLKAYNETRVIHYTLQGKLYGVLYCIRHKRVIQFETKSNSIIDKSRQMSYL